MTKAMLKTMAAIAVVASLMISGANRIAMAQGASPPGARDGGTGHQELHDGLGRSG